MSKKVLIIDDDIDVVEAMKIALESVGYEIESAGDSDDGFVKLLEFKPDLVILDVMLPNRSGFDILRDIGKMEGAPCVLMLTAKGQARDRHTAEDIGVTRFMTKPFANAEIVATVKELLE